MDLFLQPMTVLKIQLEQGLKLIVVDIIWIIVITVLKVFQLQQGLKHMQTR